MRRQPASVPPPEPEEASLTKGQAFFQATAAAVAANPAIYGALESIEDTENVRDLILNFIDSLTRMDKAPDCPFTLRRSETDEESSSYGTLDTVADDQPVNDLILNFIDGLTRMDRGS